MSLSDILQHRRAVRHYDASQPLDTQKVQACLRLAQLAPSSSNMQLYEFYHITDKKVLGLLAKACLSQQAAVTADQLVVFVTRQDKYQERARAALDFEINNVQRYSPVEKRAGRIKNLKRYYEFLMPTIYHPNFAVTRARQLVFGAMGRFKPVFDQVSANDVRVMVHKSCALAAQTFMLAMAEQGYDTCPMEGFDSQLVKKILKLPASAEINMIIACGIRSEKGVWGQRFRLPFDQVYHQI